MFVRTVREKKLYFRFIVFDFWNIFVQRWWWCLRFCRFDESRISSAIIKELTGGGYFWMTRVQEWGCYSLYTVLTVWYLTLLTCQGLNGLFPFLFVWWKLLDWQFHVKLIRCVFNVKVTWYLGQIQLFSFSLCKYWHITFMHI